jgi:hypothetical protein
MTDSHLMHHDVLIVCYAERCEFAIEKVVLEKGKAIVFGCFDANKLSRRLVQKL